MINVESVTGEMFAECRELLQAFSLLYVIVALEKKDCRNIIAMGFPAGNISLGIFDMWKGFIEIIWKGLWSFLLYLKFYPTVEESIAYYNQR